MDTLRSPDMIQRLNAFGFKLELIQLSSGLHKRHVWELAATEIASAIKRDHPGA
jgi:hypothetical protein